MVFVVTVVVRIREKGVAVTRLGACLWGDFRRGFVGAGFYHAWESLPLTPTGVIKSGLYKNTIIRVYYSYKLFF
jgi:hypothetical protein